MLLLAYLTFLVHSCLEIYIWTHALEPAALCWHLKESTRHSEVCVGSERSTAATATRRDHPLRKRSGGVDGGQSAPLHDFCRVDGSYCVGHVQVPDV